MRLAEALRSDGFDYSELARAVARGQLTRVRHGAYVRQAPADPIERHRQLVAATLPRCASDSVLSHMSAAAVHGLPTWSDELGRVHLTRPGGGSGRRGAALHTHRAEIPADQVTVVDGLVVTDLTRTVADVARVSTYERGVVVGDAAMNRGLDLALLHEVLLQSPRRVGDPQARRVAAFIRPGAESGGESMSRIVLHRLGLATPTLQYEICDPATGTVVARSDFAWPEFRTLGEFDGRLKYGRFLRSGQTPGDVVFAEKVREDLLRELGWEVVRWIWDDLRHPEQIAARLERAFARGRRRA